MNHDHHQALLSAGMQRDTYLRMHAYSIVRMSWLTSYNTLNQPARLLLSYCRTDKISESVPTFAALALVLFWRCARYICTYVGDGIGPPMRELMRSMFLLLESGGLQESSLRPIFRQGTSSLQSDTTSHIKKSSEPFTNYTLYVHDISTEGFRSSLWGSSFISRGTTRSPTDHLHLPCLFSPKRGESANG